MSFLNISKIFAKYFQDEQRESYTYDFIASILKDKSNKENYYLVPKARLERGGIVFEIGLLLLHPTLGVYIIEAKNRESAREFFAKNPYEANLLYRKIYIALTRARENIYLDIGKQCPSKEINAILEIIQKFSKKQEEQSQEAKSESKNSKISHTLSLAKIRPILPYAKESAEFIVAAREIFAIIIGLCAI